MRYFRSVCQPPSHLFSINFSAVSSAHNEDAQITVLDADDDSPVPNAVLPESFTNTARIVELGDTAMQKSKDSSGDLRVDLA